MLSDEQVDALKAKYGRKLVEVEADDGQALIFKKPSKPAWDRFVDKLTRERESKSTAIDELARACFVWPEDSAGKPDYAVFNAVIAEAPAFAASVIDDLSKMAGASETSRGKAL